MTIFGVSHDRTVLSGANTAGCLLTLELYEELKPMVRDQLLPAARRSLGADHDYALGLDRELAAALFMDPRHTRDNLRLKSGVST